MRKLLLVLLCLFTLPVFASWQTQTRGQYTWYVDGQDQAFPVSNGYYMKAQSGSATIYYHPMIDPQTGHSIHFMYYVDGSNMWTKLTSRGEWAPVYTCNLTSTLQQMQTAYNQFTVNSGSDYYAFYYTYYLEMKQLHNVCSIIVGNQRR